MKAEKSPYFVSVVLALSTIEVLDYKKILELQAKLDHDYWDYEILIVHAQERQSNQSQEVNKILKNIPSVRFIQLSGNVPEDVLFECGAENSIGDFVVLFEYGVDPVEIIALAISKCAAGSDIIVGISNYDNSWIYRGCRRIGNFALAISDYNLPKNSTNFRVLSRRAVNSVFSSGKQSQKFFMRIQSGGFEWTTFPYRSIQPLRKKLVPSLKKTLNLVVFNSLKPLRLVSLFGFLGSLSAFGFAAYSFLVQLVKKDVVEGWTSTVLILSFFFFIQFVMLSFICEYLARLLSEQNRESPYSVLYEKNSSVMVNRDRLNVFEEGESREVNQVQTGRNK